MSTFAIKLSRVQTFPGSGWRQSLSAFVRRRWEDYLARRAQRFAAAHLRSLNDYQIKDMGISRGQIGMAVMGLDDRGEYAGRNR